VIGPRVPTAKDPHHVSTDQALLCHELNLSGFKHSIYNNFLNLQRRTDQGEFGTQARLRVKQENTQDQMKTAKCTISVIMEYSWSSGALEDYTGTIKLSYAIGQPMLAVLFPNLFPALLLLHQRQQRPQEQRLPQLPIQLQHKRSHQPLPNKLHLIHHQRLGQRQLSLQLPIQLTSLLHSNHHRIRNPPLTL